MDEKGYINTLIELVENVPESYSTLANLCNDVGDLIEPIKITKGFFDFCSEQRLKVFLQNFYCRFRINLIEDNFKEKLKIYLKKPKNLNFIADTITSAIYSRSINCTALLGLYTGELLVRLEEIKSIDYIIILALKNMLDHDLDNFVEIYKALFEEDYEKTYRLCDQKHKLGEDVFELELTLEKMKNFQVLGYDIGGYGNSGNAWGMFTFNRNSRYFYELLNKFGV